MGNLTKICLKSQMPRGFPGGGGVGGFGIDRCITLENVAKEVMVVVNGLLSLFFSLRST